MALHITMDAGDRIMLSNNTEIVYVKAGVTPVFRFKVPPGHKSAHMSIDADLSEWSADDADGNAITKGDWVFYKLQVGDRVLMDNNVEARLRRSGKQAQLSVSAPLEVKIQKVTPENHRGESE